MYIMVMRALLGPSKVPVLQRGPYFTEVTLLYRGDFITVNKRAVIDILLS